MPFLLLSFPFYHLCWFLWPFPAPSREGADGGVGKLGGCRHWLELWPHRWIITALALAWFAFLCTHEVGHCAEGQVSSKPEWWQEIACRQYSSPAVMGAPSSGAQNSLLIDPNFPASSKQDRTEFYHLLLSLFSLPISVLLLSLVNLAKFVSILHLWQVTFSF